MQDITSELNEAIKLAEKLNDLLYNLSIDLDGDDQFTPESHAKLKELKEFFAKTPTSEKILDHIEALSEHLGE